MTTEGGSGKRQTEIEVSRQLNGLIEREAARFLAGNNSTIRRLGDREGHLIISKTDFLPEYMGATLGVTRCNFVVGAVPEEHQESWYFYESARVLKARRVIIESSTGPIGSMHDTLEQVDRPGLQTLLNDLQNSEPV